MRKARHCVISFTPSTGLPVTNRNSAEKKNTDTICLTEEGTIRPSGKAKATTQWRWFLMGINFNCFISWFAWIHPIHLELLVCTFYRLKNSFFAWLALVNVFIIVKRRHLICHPRLHVPLVLLRWRVANCNVPAHLNVSANHWTEMFRWKSREMVEVSRCWSAISLVSSQEAFTSFLFDPIFSYRLPFLSFWRLARWMVKSITIDRKSK